MRVLALVQGHFGERKTEVWKERGPKDWMVEVLRLKGPFPLVVEDVDEFLPSEVPVADLVVSLGEEAGVLEVVPEVVRRAQAKALLIPVDNRAWVPPGLVKQVEKVLASEGVEVISPVPFCSLKESDSTTPFVREFAKFFGLPELELEVEGERIVGGKVIRSAPCGSTYFVLENLKGERIQDAEEKAGLLHHNYPCLATMTIDWQFQDTLMHRAGYFVKEAVKRALRGYLKR